MKRKNTKVVKVGNVKIGGGNPIVVQSMTKTFTRDIAKTVRQIKELEQVGCEIVRVAVPDFESARAIKDIKKKIKIPIVADIHFNYMLAIEAIRNGADKIRINPGNIGSEEDVKLVIEEAKKAKIPIRIGLNSGSIKAQKHKVVNSMLDKLRDYIEMFNKYNFDDIVISAKSSSVLECIDVYRKISDKYLYPLHLGVTESGSILTGAIKSSIGLGILLAEGIGDTLRVSLTDDPVQEVKVAYEILKSLNLRQYGINIISCPTCGRCKIDLNKIVSSFEKKIAQEGLRKNITVAIMGCEVNGPGEAKHADIGVAFGKNFGLLFVKGKPIKKVSKENCISELSYQISLLK